jgi:hypothetical protein
VVSIFAATPLALIFGILGAIFDCRKWYAIAGLLIGGGMVALIGGSLIVSLWC